MEFLKLDSNEDFSTKKSSQLKRKFQPEDDEPQKNLTSKKIRKCQNSFYKISSIEEFGRKCPTVFKDIMAELDNQSLVNLKTASYQMYQIMNEETYTYIRMLKNYVCCHSNEFPEAWRKVIEKTPFHIGKSKFLFKNS